MSIHIHTGEHTLQGGVDITISLTPAERAAVGGDAGLMADWFDTALWALVILRTGRTDRHGGAPRDIGKHDFDEVISDLDNRLLPRLEGIRDAAVRRHRDLGATVADLALAMDVSRSTAQARREALDNPGPRKEQDKQFEQWANGPH